jgi:hypothetical protein
MAHFAKLNDSNIVIAVHVVNNDVITIDGVESEQAGIDFLSELYGHNKWKQTSYNGNFRTRYAGVGFSYDENFDAFIPPKPHDSWILNVQTKIWEAPIPMPEDHGYGEGKKLYKWDEETLSWVEINGAI